MKFMKTFVAVAVVSAAGGGFLGGSVLHGKAGPENEACLPCHDKALIGDSVHGSLSCLDCHPGAALRTGDPPHAPAKDIPRPDCTARCHNLEKAGGESPQVYADSVHGRAYLERDVPDVAHCWDCHGKHSIRPASDPASLIYRANIPMTCSRCHEDMHVVLNYNIHAEQTYQEYRRSVHGRALFEKGLVSFAAVCTDCHGVHSIQGAGTPGLRAKNPETCGNCHILIFEQYKNSIHGREALGDNVDAPGCVDCHGEHGLEAVDSAAAPTTKTHIPDTCSTCHSRPELMRKYGVPEDRLRTFIDSFHGIAIGYGDKAEASCTSCHGVHDILPASDPASRVNPANLAQTCGQTDCHPRMPDRIAEAKIHRDVRSRSSGAPFYVRKVFLGIILVSIGLTSLWFIPELIRRIRRPKSP